MPPRLADAPVSREANRAARYIPLVGAFELVVWLVLGATILVELCFTDSGALSRGASLSLIESGHIVAGVLALGVAACPQLLVAWFFLALAMVLAIVDVTVLVVRSLELADAFPSIGFFAFVYAAFNVVLLVLAFALVAVAWRAGGRYYGYGLAESRADTNGSDTPLFDKDK